MHFWIDKRSQCAYTGRHRVPSSISSGGGRCGGRACRKAPAPIHRLSAADQLPTRRSRSRRRHQTPPPPAGAASSRRGEDASLYVEIPAEPPQPTIASLAAARSVTPDTLLRTAALGLSNNSQMMAPHLKFGMLVSFVIATIFMAGAKFYFDKQVVRDNRAGEGAGAVCAGVGGACLIACCLALCRQKPSPPLDPPCRVSSTALRRSPTRSAAAPPASPAAGGAGGGGEAPPPYHIAVLLPPRPHSPSPPPAYK